MSVVEWPLLAVIGQNANVSKVPNSEHELVGKDVSCTG
jgi:hypothetical protein